MNIPALTLADQFPVTKLIQCPHTWLVSVSKEDQARWHVLSDLPPVDVGKSSQRLNKLPFR